MEDIISHIALAAILFAVTNIDDLLLLSIYFATPGIRVSHVIIGQYVGILLLVAISLGGFMLGKFIDPAYIRWLGLVPVILGVKGLYHLYFTKKDEDASMENPGASLTFINVAIITLANGGDNIGVYAPVFAQASATTIQVYVATFLVLIAVWCLAGFYFVKHPLIRRVFERYGKIILPYFLIILGLWILFG